MPSEKSRYVPAPPIPTYDEATSSSRSQRPPPPSPLDTRPASETEAQSLLSTRNNRPLPLPGRSGYRPPYIESDDEGSEWSLDDDDVEHNEDAQVRREMQELEVEDPLDSSSSTSSSSWRKRIALSLPQWKWRWRLPRLTVRLPRQNDGAADTDSSETTTVRRWCRMPSLSLNRSTALLMVGRLLAIFLVLGFLYVLFISDVFTSVTRRIGGQMFDPEAVRQFVQANVDPARMRDTLEHFTSYAHIAGTQGDYALAMDVRNSFIRDGLEEVAVDNYYVYLNYPKAGGRAVEIMSEDGGKASWTAALEEMEVGGETAGRQTFVFHGHSKAGDVKGPLMYANYGSRKDFKMFLDKGIDTEGAIALVRYHGTQDDPALKVKAAEMSGFAGCIIYSDPADDGFVRGDTAPNGRYMPADGVQRGSVSLTNWVIGDVLTPGWESSRKEDQPRMSLADTHGLPKIPSIPIAWRDAQVLLQHLKGVGVACPDDWRGGVPEVEWWTGNSSSPIVRLKNEQDEDEKQEILNVYAKIVGIEQSEKSIIIGNHRDAWAFGASDPNSGTAVMMEVARIYGELAARGWRPLRTVEFMSWDAGEYNMIGSTEYVEKNLENLQKNAFAYINLDTAVSGQEFHASGSPVFRKVIYKVLDRVTDPNFNTTLRALWDERNADIEGLGLGSDYVAFQDMAGTSSVDLRFEGGSHPYHSSYDNFDWMERVGDPNFTYHTLLGQVLALLVLELADRPILPFDLGNYALSMGRYVGDLYQWTEEKGLNQGGGGKKVNLDPIKAAVKEVEAAVAKFELWEPYWEQSIVAASGWEPTGLGQRRAEINTRMAAFESGLLDLEMGGGLPNRTQFKHVIFGPQLWSSYDETYFAGIRDAADAEDWALAQKIADKTAVIIGKAAKELVSMG